MCVSAAVSLRYLCVRICARAIFYVNACQGDTRAKCSLCRGRAQRWRLMCFRQATGGTPVQALNPWETRPRSPRVSEWKYVRSSCVCLSVWVSVREGVGGVRFTERRAAYFKYTGRKRTKVRLILLISGITDADSFLLFYLSVVLSLCHRFLLSRLFAVWPLNL